MMQALGREGRTAHLCDINVRNLENSPVGSGKPVTLALSLVFPTSSPHATEAI